MKFADLHIHTFFSDSTNSPKDIIKLAKECGLSCIAITDHDTVKGIEPTNFEASNSDLEIIAAIELTGEEEGTEVHILGYFIDWHDSWFLDKLDQMRKIRIERIYEMTAKLKSLGITIDAEEVINSASIGSVGRLHLARVMQKHNVVGSVHEAFAKYIGDKGSAYVSKFRITPYEAISMIKKVKGIPVLAHPHTLNKDDFISYLVKGGLEGLEVYYPDYSPLVTERYKKIADKFNLLVTGGSDCHGQIKNDAYIGKIKIPYELVEKLKLSRGII